LSPGDKTAGISVADANTARMTNSVYVLSCQLKFLQEIYIC
jgi:hypothetical protein